SDSTDPAVPGPPDSRSGEGEAEQTVGSGDEAGPGQTREPPGALRGFPSQPRRPSDALIGPLRATSLEADPAELPSVREAEAFFAALFAGEEGVTDSFYDPFTAEAFSATLRSRCDSVRVALPERLPQQEWAVPFRCLLDEEPKPVRGTLFVVEGAVVDGIIELTEAADEVDPEGSRRDEMPF
ncbi:MAG: hypothetical protein ACOC45_06090, partial [Alkalispirochaetaceae bacterium]